MYNIYGNEILIGGIPQVVLSYLKNKDFEASDVIKRRILELYRNDISKFARGYEDKVFAIFDQIPGQLSKKEKKYTFSSINKEARFRTFEDSFLWLNEAMIVNTCFNTTDLNIGLVLSQDNSTFKCYMADTGLLITQVFMNEAFTNNNLYKAILFDKLDINEGMIMENVIAQILRSNGHKLFFYSRCDNIHRENHMVIDFIISEGKRFLLLKLNQVIIFITHH